MAEINVCSAKCLPNIIQPAKNKPQDKTVTITLTEIDGIILFTTMAIPDIPPVTKSKGIIKIAPPKAKITVPKTVNPMFFIRDLKFSLFNFIKLPPLF